MDPSFSLRLIFTTTEMKLEQKGTVMCHMPTACQTLEEHSIFIHSAITAKDRSLTVVT